MGLADLAVDVRRQRQWRLIFVCSLVTVISNPISDDSQGPLLRPFVRLQTILVIEGAGCIGFHTVVQLLNEGFRVSIIDDLDNSVTEAVDRVSDLFGPKRSQNLEFHLGDLRNKDLEKLFSQTQTVDRTKWVGAFHKKQDFIDVVEPVDYEPPFFKGCTEEEARNPWTKNPLRMEVGNVNSKHLVLALKVKSVLDPCEDENEDIQDDEMSLGADSVQKDDSSDSDSEVNHSEENQYIVAPVDKHQQEEDNNGMVDEDDTQDPEEDEQQLARVKEWINDRHIDTVDFTDVLSNFPDISMVLTEEIMEKLVKEGVLSKTGRDSYTINKQKNSDYEFTMVKEEMDGQTTPFGGKVPQVEDSMYMKALYHALPMNYVTVAKLQSKLEGEANQTTVRKIINKMTLDGFLEAKGSRRLGKRVIHSEMTKKKLLEVKKALNTDAMDIDTNEPNNKSSYVELQKMGSNYNDMSTCGALHSIGSDLTRVKVRSEINQNGSIRSEQTISKTKEHGNTPTSRVEPVASRESFVPGYENGRANGNANYNDEVDGVICSRSSQERRSRKTSTVREPILQYFHDFVFRL
ncbi:hypothetical protein CMV_020224 [Castanea mollissima]|uniref:NAD(P)-binding domain-containing protein n=1 Tax=Castanea mollissima TaxID=60419 RepID=A0A8J4QYZ6_9ROSI|nr:hypothetical protein CMV_020224 [Castanea mollissima]